MITEFRAKNYGCLRDLSFKLTPLHALIGPNDSGKSTILRGLRTLVHLANDGFSVDGRSVWEPFDPTLGSRSDATSTVSLGVSTAGHTYDVRWEGTPSPIIPLIEAPDPGGAKEYPRNWSIRPYGPPSHPPFSELRGVRLVRFDADVLKRPSGLVPEKHGLGFLDERGGGLPGVYYAIRDREPDDFRAIVHELRRLFPYCKTLRIPALATDSLTLEVVLNDETQVRAPEMSEGLLYFLAFAALQRLSPVSLLLVEEPENGLHPSRIADVMRILRAFVTDQATQVVLATHSPLVVNTLEPQEVSVVTRTSLEQGTRVTPIQNTANFERRSSVYALGELWLSYADGEFETPLIKGVAGE